MSSQAIYLSMSILSLCGLTGMGVAVGSGVGLMAMELEKEEARLNQAPSSASPTAASPLEKSVFQSAFRGFASSAL
eukprot:CAMPEP_0196570242 /NCGR_PEP_ID=MMETSP1081-20130531/76_1 /TAXON_ID=36882 /ORGANISM="Pyramimonas amylifera, Strain CCMP720" /LENGTH=75 /DNA_ID=CAMNT_0041886549 /DNA_START=82 /DNA_END=309 /DNA_ORIENTATION=+